METRSKRQQAVQRPAYPQISTYNATSLSPSTSSASSSAFQSSSSLTSYPSPRSAKPGDTAQSVMYARSPTHGSSGPLPSPLAQQPSLYFGSIATTTSSTGHAHQMQTQPAHVAARGGQNLQQQQQQFMGQRGSSGGAPETAPYLNNFNLVAEAAKRAQMDCLMRDLNDVEL